MSVSYTPASCLYRQRYCWLVQARCERVDSQERQNSYQKHQTLFLNSHSLLLQC